MSTSSNNSYLNREFNHVVIGVDEAHADSLEALNGGLSFVGASPNCTVFLHVQKKISPLQMLFISKFRFVF